MSETQQCPCGQQNSYDECCGTIIDGKQVAKTAEALMRSRYTAFALNKMDHIRNSHDPSTRSELDMEGNQAWSSRADWKSLKIVKTEKGTEEDDNGVVEFIARYDMEGEPQEHHELSTFRKVKGQWYFVDGKNLALSTFQREEPKLGRNDPCHCGSGKKFKKCCGK